MSSPTPQDAGGAVSAPFAIAVAMSMREASTAASAERMPRSAPEIIEIEPVVRREPAVVLEAFDVLFNRLRNDGIALAARDVSHVHEALEVDVIAVAAAIQAEHDADGT